MAVDNPNGKTVSVSAVSYSMTHAKSNNTPGPDNRCPDSGETHGRTDRNQTHT